MAGNACTVIGCSMDSKLVYGSAGIRTVLGLRGNGVLVNAPRNCRAVVPRSVLAADCSTGVCLANVRLGSKVARPSVLGNDSLRYTRRLSFARGRGSFALSFSTLSLIRASGVGCTCGVRSG